MRTCKIHGDKMMRDADGPYCQLCYEAAADDGICCDHPQCNCDFDCERMVQHQRYTSVENLI